MRSAAAPSKPHTQTPSAPRLEGDVRRHDLARQGQELEGPYLGRDARESDVARTRVRQIDA